MSTRVRKVEYFYTTVEDRPGEAYKVLAGLSDSGIDLLALNAVPAGPMRTQLTIFPADSAQLVTVAQRLGMALDRGQHALLVQGDDEIGALARIHQDLFDAGVNVYAASGVASGSGGFGYLVYVKPDDLPDAEAALGI